MKTHETPDSATPSQGQIMCYRCGGAHLATKCKWKDVECRYCKKKGHLERVCLAKAHAQNKKVPAHYVQATEKTDTAYNLFTIKQQSGDPIVVHVELNS